MENKTEQDYIIDNYSSNEAVEDGLLFDFKQLEKLNIKSNLISYGTSNLLFKYGYLQEDKEINIPNIKDLIFQCERMIKGNDYFYSGKIETPKGNKIKVFVVLNELNKFTVMLPEDY